MKYLQVTDPKRKVEQEQKNEILIWINSLAFQYKTAQLNHFIDNPACYASASKQLI